MDKIWAPWRIHYVRKTNKNGCIFCKAVKSDKDNANYLVVRGKHAFIMLNIFPYTNGHLMVAPNRHVASLRKLDSDEIKELMKFTQIAQNMLDKVLKPQGYNIGINEGRLAGAGIVSHVHIHVVPRWLGDINFMPVTASTKVISQSLNELYSKLIRLKK